MTFQTFTARLTQSKPLTEFTKHLEFEMENVARFGFVPGQWLSLKHTRADGEELTRAYSIASPPGENGRFALCLNRVQEGFMSNFLCDMKEGDEISCQGPFGDFILRPPLRDTIFIATGTGIAPFRSMLRDLLEPAFDDRVGRAGTPVAPRQFWLLFGARSEQDLYYRKEFEQLAGTYGNFHFLPTLSRASAEWTGLRGYVQEHLRDIVGERTDMHGYICGLDRMVSANRDLLKSLGWDRKSIRYEKYD